MEMTGEERLKAALTQEKQTFRLALLYLVQVWGNSKEKHFKGKNLERDNFTSLHDPMNKHDWISVQSAVFSRPQALGRGANGRLVEKIPGSARYEHDKKRENTGGNPPSEHQNSE